MPSNPTFDQTRYFPARRRVVQACTTCRLRKTRCDAAKPRCSLCMQLNAECVYLDSQQPRIDPNTRILLERIQLLEDRLLSAPGYGSRRPASPSNSSVGANPVMHVDPDPGPVVASGTAPRTMVEQMDPMQGTELDVQLPLLHTASANHVYKWSIVQQLISNSPIPAQTYGNRTAIDATDVFFDEQSAHDNRLFQLSSSWNLFRERELGDRTEQLALYQELVRTYFLKVNVFFPLLSMDDIFALLRDIFSCENGYDLQTPSVSLAHYCLVILVLCLASFVNSGGSTVRLDEYGASPGGTEEAHRFLVLEQRLWLKAKLLLGFILGDSTIEAAQCSMLASLYLGARGRIAEAFHWTHTTAVKCAILAKRFTAQPHSTSKVPDAFRRLFWIAYIYENDFISEFSNVFPSGMARYEDTIPYPVFEITSSSTPQNPPTITSTSPSASTSAPHNPSSDAEISPMDHAMEIAAFQISTNAAIRRFLNRVNSVVYDRKEQYRANRANYATWLLRISDELWTHHEAIYRNLPVFLLTSQREHGSEFGSPSALPSPAISNIRPEVMGNNPWNVCRLKGRYYAGQYIVYRPFIEYVLLNLSHIGTHPCRATILEKCRMCLDGCQGFIRVFDVEPAVTMTCLFATGMVIFTMSTILMVATVCSEFGEILPTDIEDTIMAGQRNLQRFSKSVKQFEWHLQELRRLDAARKARADDGKS